MGPLKTVSWNWRIKMEQLVILLVPETTTWINLGFTQCMEYFSLWQYHEKSWTSWVSWISGVSCREFQNFPWNFCQDEQALPISGPNEQDRTCGNTEIGVYTLWLKGKMYIGNRLIQSFLNLFWLVKMWWAVAPRLCVHFFLLTEFFVY